ncbi:MAG: hypothetical protein ACXVCY_04375 [Pseudobdellovibrionaceae bacterium]
MATKEVSTEEAHDLTFKIAQSFSEIVNKELENVNHIQAWLILSRAINLIFSTHYKMAVHIGQRQVDETEIEYMKKNAQTESTC